MDIQGLGYFGLRSAAIEQWRTFATGVLGATVHDTADGIALRVDDRAWRIAIDQADEEAFGYAGWELSDAEAVARAAEVLDRAGVAVQWADDDLLARRSVLGLISCKDPNGTRLELFHGATVSIDTFVSPTGARFVTGGQGLGHIVFAGDDFTETLRFYTEVLGFRVSDFCDLGRSRIAFLHTNIRHHSYAFSALVRDPKRPPKIPISPGNLFHFMLEVDDVDTVGRAYDACVDGAAPIALTLGRHSNDRMLSFYAVTPSGFEVEYGHGAVTVSDPWPATRVERTSVWGHRRPTGSGR